MCGLLRTLVGKPVSMLALILLGSLAAVAQTATPTEYQVKAAFLYNFAKFVEWPAGSIVSNDAPFVVGVLGRNPFGEDLDRTLRDKIISHRRVEVKRCDTVQAARKCQILFISSSEETRLPQILEALKGAAVLTVSEIRHFAERGGMICFIMEESKVRFEINNSNAQLAGLTLSAQLLRLAKTVHSTNRELKE